MPVLAALMLISMAAVALRRLVFMSDYGRGPQIIVENLGGIRLRARTTWGASADYSRGGAGGGWVESILCGA
nr:MAG: hypothetical protein TU35_09810 [Thermoproteus sp. AZ2]